ncbi:hypothetical protein H5410_019527 [Solanum commersonii]|uniref:Uncharacterized protein n=1 Tax=Solanum commersonii TaxID=4109 RepID=A0A9J5ZBG0_SOLCO|nr:hypothetical protein H5410_019527 [Solanum commersonii]
MIFTSSDHSLSSGRPSITLIKLHQIDCTWSASSVITLEVEMKVKIDALIILKILNIFDL